jgi:hypothetical protein
VRTHDNLGNPYNGKDHIEALKASIERHVAAQQMAVTSRGVELYQYAIDTLYGQLFELEARFASQEVGQESRDAYAEQQKQALQLVMRLRTQEEERLYERH